VVVIETAQTEAFARVRIRSALFAVPRKCWSARCRRSG